MCPGDALDFTASLSRTEAADRIEPDRHWTRAEPREGNTRSRAGLKAQRVRGEWSWVGVRAAAGRFGSLRFCSDSVRLQCLEEVFPQIGRIVTSVTVRAGPTAVSVCECARFFFLLFFCFFWSAPGHYVHHDVCCHCL